MAPRIGLRLLHMAAVLVMVTYLNSGPVLAEQIFQFDELISFDVLRGRQCLLSDFDASFLTKIDQCSAKVKSGPLPDACADVPALALLFNCFANSLNQLSVDDGAMSFDIAELEAIMRSFTDDEPWNRMQADLTSRCQRTALPYLTPQQLAVYSYMCVDYSLLAACDRQQDIQGRLDESAMLRRERVLQHKVQLIVTAFGPLAQRGWSECSSKFYTGEDVKQRYDTTVDAVVCLLKPLTDADGYVDAGALFELTFKKMPQDWQDPLRELSKYCGPSATGNQKTKVDVFIKCWMTEASFIIASYESNLVASAMPDSCAFSV